MVGGDNKWRGKGLQKHRRVGIAHRPAAWWAVPTLLFADVGRGIDGGRGEGAEDKGVLEKFFGIVGGEQAVEIRLSNWTRSGTAGFGVQCDGFKVRDRDVG